LSQHLFIVKSASELLPALRGVNAYSPVFMVEKFVPDATLYRITIVDGKEMFVVKRLPAEVMGDGKSTLRALIRKIKFNQKNLDKTVLEEQGVGLDSLIAKGKKIFLQRKAILALGSKIEKVPIAEVHRDIVAMGRAIAKHFRLPLVGIDILLRDHARPLKGQTAAILELNTLPNILIHTFRKNGEAENEVADALVDFALARFGGGRSADGARGGQTNQR
jgi:cyanophycin synthetase